MTKIKSPVGIYVNYLSLLKTKVQNREKQTEACNLKSIKFIFYSLLLRITPKKKERRLDHANGS